MRFVLLLVLVLMLTGVCDDGARVAYGRGVLDVDYGRSGEEEGERSLSMMLAVPWTTRQGVLVPVAAPWPCPYPCPLTLSQSPFTGTLNVHINTGQLKHSDTLFHAEDT